MPLTTAAITIGGTLGVPVTAGAAAGGAAAGLTFGQLALIGVGIGAASAGLVALSVKQGDAGAQTQNRKIAVGPRRRGYGRYRVGGNELFERVSKKTGDGRLMQVFALNSGQIDAIEQHWIYDKIVRLDDQALIGTSGIRGICFPATVEGAKPPASEVVITAYDPGYTAETVTANYTIGGSPTTLDAISVGVVGGGFVAIVFPNIPTDSEKPVATSVTFTTPGAGTGESIVALPNASGLWDGGNHVTIVSAGSGFSNTVGGFGAAISAQPNGEGRWDGGCTPDNVTLDAYGQNYTSSVVVTASWNGGATTLQATSVTVGSFGLPFVDGNVIYPGVWFDNGRVTVSPHLGLASQDADQVLLEGFPGVWTHQHRLDGVAYVALRLNGVPLEDWAAVYPFGIPTYAAVIRASLVYDPRDSGQSATDPETWTWSDNAALVILDYLRHPDGMRLPDDICLGDIQSWVDAADFCDEQVELLSGDFEARYRLWGSYEYNEEPKSVLGRMLNCIDGRLRLSETGAVVLDVGQFDCPTSCETIGGADILGFENLRRGASKLDLKNEIRAKYLSPGHNYIEQEADPWRDQESIDRDGLQSTSLDLTFCPSHRQARARMKQEACRQNPEWQGIIRTNAKGLRLLGKRYARFKIDALGLNETFLILRSEINLFKGVCTFRVISFPAECYCLDPCEEGESPEYRAPGNHGICVPPGAIGVTIRAIGGGGGGGASAGGGGGGAVTLHLALEAADEGAVFLFTVGDKGLGHTDDVQNLATNGGASTVIGTVTAGTANMIAGGGTRGNSGGTGGTATGGDTNIAGSNRSGGDGGASGSGSLENESPGGGGHEQVDGGIGSVTFEWEY